jgi:hypothetical protein
VRGAADTPAASERRDDDWLMVGARFARAEAEARAAGHAL